MADVCGFSRVELNQKGMSILAKAPKTNYIFNQHFIFWELFSAVFYESDIVVDGVKGARQNRFMVRIASLLS
jgi:hypothetical protein